MSQPEYRQLTPADVKAAAQVIAQSFVNDPPTSFMLPFKRTRGKGLSSRLICPFLQMADEQKVIAYTDTVTKSNVPLYEHLGFKCVEESPVADTGITVYALRRPIH